MSGRRHIAKSARIYVQQLNDLRALSDATRVPIAEIVRIGVEAVLAKREGEPAPVSMDAVSADCCVSTDDMDDMPHEGTLRCERRRDTDLPFAGEPIDCDHSTCGDHAWRAGVVVLCDGCAAELPPDVRTSWR